MHVKYRYINFLTKLKKIMLYARNETSTTIPERKKNITKNEMSL